jgi:hypothetical protein
MNFLDALFHKDSPAAADVHVSTTGGVKKPKPITGQISPDTKLPVTGIDLAGEQEEGVQPGQVGKVGARALKPIDSETAHTPFPYDPNALGALRPDQVPRFFGAITDPKKLPTKNLNLSDLTAMQDRVDPDKIAAMRAGEATGKPPVVVGMNGRNYIADGHHRASAAWLDGKDSMPVKFKDLDPVDQAVKRIDAELVADVLGKAGARHNKSDMQLLQTIHDHVAALGAECDPTNCNEEENDGEPTGAVKRDADWRLDIPISKTDEDQCLVFGWASIVQKDGSEVEDLQGDRLDPADLEGAVYPYVLNKREAGEMHSGATGVGKLVESLVMTVEKQKAMGLAPGATPLGWWVGYKLSPEVFAKVKSGEYSMFSIGGAGVRVTE